MIDVRADGMLRLISDERTWEGALEIARTHQHALVMEADVLIGDLVVDFDDSVGAMSPDGRGGNEDDGSDVHQ